MKIWLLRPILNLSKGNDPWEPWYDKAFGFVVSASSEARARELADSEAGDENHGEFGGIKASDTKNPWLDSDYSTCVELRADDEEKVIIRDFAAA